TLGRVSADGEQSTGCIPDESVQTSGTEFPGLLRDCGRSRGTAPMASAATRTQATEPKRQSNPAIAKPASATRAAIVISPGGCTPLARSLTCTCAAETVRTSTAVVNLGSA